MTAFDLNPNITWAFCMTHPDDEVAICAWIKRLTSQGNRVFMSWTHDTPIRKAEAIRVAQDLGVLEQNLMFFGGTDGGLCDEILNLKPEFQRWFDTIKPDRVVCCAFEQGHIDHDTTNLLIHLTFTGPIFEMPMYHTYVGPIQVLNRFSDDEGQEILELTEAEQKFKKKVARSFPSQRIWRILLWHEFFEVIQFRPIALAKTERLRLARHQTFLVPNHKPKLANKVANCKQWNRWKRAVLSFAPEFLEDLSTGCDLM